MFKPLLVAQSHVVMFLAILVMNGIKVILLKYVFFTGHRALSSLGLRQHTVELPHIRFGGKVGSYLQRLLHIFDKLMHYWCHQVFKTLPSHKENLLLFPQIKPSSQQIIFLKCICTKI